MPIRNAIWKVGTSPQLLIQDCRPKRAFEDRLAAALSILSEEGILISRQEKTASGGVIVLLSTAPHGTAVRVELERDRTAREVVAQALDFACWIGRPARRTSSRSTLLQPGREFERVVLIGKQAFLDQLRALRGNGHAVAI